MARTKNAPLKKRPQTNEQSVSAVTDGENKTDGSAQPAIEAALSGFAHRRRIWAKWGALPAVALMLTLRLAALDSDAYTHLSWSGALLTDEGFYIHNARNLVLFGHAVTDEWNNSLIMPTLHYVQVAVFFLCGVGTVQARLISVVLSLLTLAIFFVALRRAFGECVAFIGTLLLGLDHINLLYNRMALMDTPAVLPMTAAFAAFVWTTTEGTSKRPGYYFLSPALLCGLLLGLAYATRGLSAFLLPVPLLVLWRAGRKREARAVLIGVALSLGLYLLLWYLPHQAELTRLNRYYLTYQLLPRSLGQLKQNLAHAVFGDYRGLSPDLFRHTPILFALALAWLLTGMNRKLTGAQALCARFLAGWLVLGWAVLSVVGYAPSRYYVLFYPALTALVALALAHLEEIGAALKRHTLLRCGLGTFLAYHLGEAFLHHANRLADVLLYSFVALAALLLYALPSWWQARQSRPRFAGSACAAVALGVWGLVNLCWMGDWLLHLTYRQKAADQWLATHLPPGSVLLGDVAPGLCLNNRFVAVNVIPRLCNDKRPVERFAPAPRYIVILDGKWKEPWWMKQYSELVAPKRRLHLFPRLLRYPVGAYIVPADASDRRG